MAPADFKSLVPDIKTANEINDDYMGFALAYQFLFKRKTSPCERSSWNENDLQNFTIDVNQIDRLYSMTPVKEDILSGGRFYLLSRMKYMDKDMFVELTAFCDSFGFAYEGGGEIYITSNVDIFYNAVVSRLEQRKSILASLIEDKYYITIQPEVAENRVPFCHNPPELKLLCHVVVRDNQQCLAHYPDVLPKLLTDSLNEFIRVNEAMDDYLFA